MNEAALRPSAIIDIGSNSVRLVIFQRLARVPVELHTEQIYPHLGRQIGKTGRLDPEGKSQCLDGLCRYAALCDAYNVGDRLVVATAAIRDATDGPHFVAEITQLTGLEVTILSGVEEGRLSAMGVLAGIPHADGLVGDIGGGSLELALVSNGQVGDRTTLPLGPFRLQRYGDHRSKRDDLIRFIDAQLDTVPWIEKAKGKSFYAVGGNWRAIAKVQIKREQHPLDIVHRHELSFRQGKEIAEFLSTLSQQSLERFAVAHKRSKLVPYAAMVLERVLEAVKPKSLIFSGYGLREGLVFDRLTAAEKNLDPLFAACCLITDSNADRSILKQWTDPLFPGETPEETRLRHAVCLLADCGKADNPVHRAQSAYERALYLRSGDLDHAGRAFIAYALYIRYDGSLESRSGKAVMETVERLLPLSAIRRAARLGKILEFAESLSAGSLPLLQHARLSISGRHITLEYGSKSASLVSEAMRVRFVVLAQGLHLIPLLLQTGVQMHEVSHDYGKRPS
jgi:exopolyphosphatase/guanosine-5'-triphosphate,3'-diphosphate pyrophosphatase